MRDFAFSMSSVRSRGEGGQPFPICLPNDRGDETVRRIDGDRDISVVVQAYGVIDPGRVRLRDGSERQGRRTDNNVRQRDTQVGVIRIDLCAKVERRVSGALHSKVEMRDGLLRLLQPNCRDTAHG